MPGKLLEPIHPGEILAEEFMAPLGLSANALATVCIHPGIPVLMLIGHSGGVGEENAGHATVGSLTEPVLQAMHIVYEKVGRFDDIRPTIRDSQILARSSRRPTAIVLNKQALR